MRVPGYPAGTRPAEPRGSGRVWIGPEKRNPPPNDLLFRPALDWGDATQGARHRCAAAGQQQTAHACVVSGLWFVADSPPIDGGHERVWRLGSRSLCDPIYLLPLLDKTGAEQLPTLQRSPSPSNWRQNSE